MLHSFSNVLTGQDPTTIAIPKSGPDYSDRGYEDNDGNGRSAVVKPTLEYCTQACLLGLVRKKELDGRCPNYALHKNGINQNNRHTVTQSQLVDIIERQLLSTPKTNCECQFENKRSMSYPFKITLTGLGYTFVGKAVQERYRAALVHESQIYTRLLRLQGSAIPVHLGLIELTIPYPLPDQFVTLPYMMFTSYAGKAVPSECWESDDSDEEEEEEEDEEYSDSENSDSGSTRDMGSPVVNYRSETERTLKELSDMGFYEQHTNPANIRWCDNAQRVMRTDFDHAFLEPCEEDLIFDYNSTVCTTLETGTKTEFKVVHDLESDSRDSKRVKYSY
ncbi:uncharacterized protein BROUX77_000763 [Berkeleyomyces rouxiae]|uniref:uncharacterized protein n=1 Tax=Berkeleyomyces rouxiae TaxID=2035830 RepID=UPI003B7809DD